MIYSNISVFMQNRYYGANFTDKQTAFLIPYLHRYREDADELHNYLNELKRALVEEDQERLPKEQLDRRRFLNKFPRVKQQLEEFIGKFHELADKAEKVHKGCTISNVMAHSTGAVSGILTIVGWLWHP